ncbi:hypothetical protein ES707_16969 [subsurface metagenome]
MRRPSFSARSLMASVLASVAYPYPSLYWSRTWMSSSVRRVSTSRNSAVSWESLRRFSMRLALSPKPVETPTTLMPVLRALAPRARPVWVPPEPVAW